MHNRQLARGGADIQMEREAAALEARGHTVETMLVDNREVETIGHVRSAAKAVWNGAAVRELKERIARFQPDVVHVQTPFPIMSPAVFVVAHRAGIPVVTTSQSFRYSCVKATMYRDGAVCEECVGRAVKIPALRHRCYKGSLAGTATMVGTLGLHRAAGTFTRDIDRFIALTPFMRERIIAEGIAPERVDVLPHTPPDPGPPVVARDGTVAFVGRLVEEKGIRTILAAWRELDDDVPLVIAGDGVLRPEVEAAAAADPRIDFRGWLEGPPLEAIVAGAEALVMASEWYEGFGVVITEAYAAGTPVLASDVGNFTDMIRQGHNGLRYRCGDPASLAASVHEFFTTVDRPAMRHAARTSYEQEFHPDVVMDRLVSIYETVIAERRTAPG